MKFNHNTHRLLREFLTSTQISEYYPDNLIRENNIALFSTERGETISKADFKKLISSPNFKLYFKETLKFAHTRYERDNIKENIDYFEDINDKIYTYIKEKLERLIKNHNLVLKDYNLVNDETAEVATCLLFVNAFTMFNTFTKCIKDKSLSVGIFIRPINESINLAKYFLVEKHSPRGQDYLFIWFRNNHTPRTEIVFDSVKKFNKTIIGEELSDFLESISFELINSASKSIHNSYSSTIKGFIYETENDNLVFEKIEYEESSNLRETLNNLIYAQSLLLSIYITYLGCFKKIINTTDANILNAIESDRTELQNNYNKNTAIYNHINEYN